MQWATADAQQLIHGQTASYGKMVDLPTNNRLRQIHPEPTRPLYPTVLAFDYAYATAYAPERAQSPVAQIDL